MADKRELRSWRILLGSSRICVNPLSWKHDSDSVPTFTDATCQDGRVLVRQLGELPKRDAASAILLRVMGPDNYHPIEYQLFYMNLRQNAERRVDAYLAAHPNSP